MFITSSHLTSYIFSLSLSLSLSLLFSLFSSLLFSPLLSSSLLSSPLLSPLLSSPLLLSPLLSSPLLFSSLLFSSLTLTTSAFHLSIWSEVWLLNFLRWLSTFFLSVRVALCSIKNRKQFVLTLPVDPRKTAHVWWRGRHAMLTDLQGLSVPMPKRSMFHGREKSTTRTKRGTDEEIWKTCGETPKSSTCMVDFSHRTVSL